VRRHAAADRQKDVLVARGMDEPHFALNPLVTLNHNYWLPPVGRSLWRKRTKDGPTPGVKAKTAYPPRPRDWPADQEWAPDSAFALVLAGPMNGKSVGYLAVKSHAPTAEEIKRRPELAQVRRIVEEWVLLEYGCGWPPVSPARCSPRSRSTDGGGGGLASPPSRRIAASASGPVLHIVSAPPRGRP
jgi:hypothetical protein